MVALLSLAVNSSILASPLVPNANLSSKRNPLRVSSIRPLRTLAFVLRCSVSNSPFSSTFSALSSSSLATSSVADSGVESPALRILRLSNEFRSLPEPIDRVKRLLFYAADLPPFSDADRVPSNRVTGCTAQVWVSARIDALGRMRFAADSDSEITRGFCACLLAVVDGAQPEDVLAMRADDLADLNVIGVAGRTQSRVNTWHNVLISMQKKTLALLADGEGGTGRSFSVPGNRRRRDSL